MIDENAIVRRRQRLIRKAMADRNISVKEVQYGGGWDYPSTVTSYFPAADEKEPAIMSVAALYRLIDRKALPLDLLSLLLPDDYQVVRKPDGMDLDAFEALCRDFLAAKGAAHHPESEAGRELGPGENSVLLGKAAHLRAVA